MRMPFIVNRQALDDFDSLLDQKVRFLTNHQAMPTVCDMCWLLADPCTSCQEIQGLHVVLDFVDLK